MAAGKHHDHLALFLCHHHPEVFHGVFHGTLGSDVSPPWFVIITGLQKFAGVREAMWVC